MNQIWRDRLAGAIVCVYALGWPISLGAFAFMLGAHDQDSRGGEYVGAFLGAWLWPLVWLGKLGYHLATFL